MPMEMKMRRSVTLYGGDKGAWHFVVLPKGLSQDLRKFFAGMERGFGSLPVQVSIGKTTWKTSIFPESKDGAFMFPIKAEVRKKENIKEGDMLSFSLKIIV
jgi:hypothetical protein